ncbi:alkane 1-monooxygenase, partial [Methylophaga nitratireducenticrescens]
TYWSPQEKDQAGQMLGCSVIGSHKTVQNGLLNLIEKTQADELMIVSDIFDTTKRQRSIEITAQAMA